MKNKHTPGPWSIGPRTNTYCAFFEKDNAALKAAGLPLSFDALSIGTNKGQVAIIPLDESSPANALLISATPDMLEALEELVDEMNSVWKSEFRGIRDPEDNPDLNKYRKLIAKARGES